MVERSVDYAWVEEVLTALGVDEPNFVQQVIMRPDMIEITTFKKNAEGRKYVDLERGVPATEKTIIGVSPS